MDILNMLVNIAAISVAAIGILAFLKHPLNVGLVVAALHSVFLILPMFLYVNFRPGFLEYSMSSLGMLSPHDDHLGAQVITVLTAAAWIGGSLLAQHMRLGLPCWRLPLPAGDRILRPRAASLVLASAVLLGLSVAKGDFSFLEIISPSRKTIEDLYGSYWIATFLIYVPALLAAVVIASQGRIRSGPFLLLLFSLLVALGTGQRRTIFLLAFIVFVSRAIARSTGSHPGLSERRLRKDLVSFLIVVAPLGPLLWVARSYFTQVYADLGPVTNPFEFRGFWELFFGSAATGFRTAMSTLEVWEAGGVLPGYSLLYIFVAPVPRQFWADKPISPDGVLQNYLNLDSNPSLFVVADLVFSFYLLAPLAALVLSYLVSRIGVVLWRHVLTSALASRKVAPAHTVMLAIYAAGAIVLFKNGIAPFVIFVLSTAAMLMIVSLATVGGGKDARRR